MVFVASLAPATVGVGFFAWTRAKRPQSPRQNAARFYERALQGAVFQVRGKWHEDETTLYKERFWLDVTWQEGKRQYEMRYDAPEAVFLQSSIGMALRGEELWGRCPAPPRQIRHPGDPV